MIIDCIPIPETNKEILLLIAQTPLFFLRLSEGLAEGFIGASSALLGYCYYHPLLFSLVPKQSLATESCY